MSKKYKAYEFGIECPEGCALDNLEECMEELNQQLKEIELLNSQNRELKLTVARLNRNEQTATQ